MLGVPTVADRIAQTVVAMTLEPRLEAIFQGSSYGYRRGRSALDAVQACRERCWQRDWVVDLDIQDFFGSCPHDLIIKAVEANTDQPWVVLYVRRWLSAPVQYPDGSLVAPDRGTPQGFCGVTGARQRVPALRARPVAGPGVPGRALRALCGRRGGALRDAASGRTGARGDRPEAVGLRLHPARTRVVYRKDSNRRGMHEHTVFTFLGYTFRPRRQRNMRTGRNFTSFDPAISEDALKAKSAEIRSWRIHQRTGSTLDDLAHTMNPIVRGWMNYWGRFNRREMGRLLRRINAYLMKWAQKKYKRLCGYKRARAWWKTAVERDRGLFAHWAWERNAWMAG
jgi:hypothetical protein